MLHVIAMTMNSDLHILTYHFSPVLAVSLLVYNKQGKKRMKVACGEREREREKVRERREERRGESAHSTMKIIRQTTSNRAIPNMHNIMAPVEAPTMIPTDTDISAVPVIGIPDATMTPSPPVLTART